MLTIYGHLDSISGVARHASGFAHAISRHLDVAWVPLDPTRLPTSEPWRQWLEKGRADLSTTIGLGIGAPDVMTRIRGRRRIGWVVWETSRMPESRLRHLRDLDEIWTPTAWGRQILIDSGLRTIPIRVVPEGVDSDLFRPIPQDGTGDRPFRFLCVGKWERRKGFDLLLRAWARAFTPDDPVELILHTYDERNSGWSLDAALDELGLGAHAPVHWSRPTRLLSLVLLYNRSDVFVSATRGEGWGLPIFEALACAKPVIAPAFGALDELLDDQVADRIETDSRPAAYGWDTSDDEDVGFWGEPSVDHLVELLRRAFEHPERGTALGQRGRAAVLERWTWDRAAEIALAELSRDNHH
ncbi:MAG: glycosyltransferase [Acidobacteriota bacterium]